MSNRLSYRGVFACSLSLLMSTMTLAEVSAEQLKSNKPKASVDSEGFIVLDGERFFPLGLYHGGLNSDRPGEKIVEDMATIAEAGFSTIHLSMDFTADGSGPRTSTAGKIARAAEANGLKLAVYVYLPSLERVAGEHARWPAVLFSALGDDFNTDRKGRHIGPPKLPPDQLRLLHRRVERVAPAQLTYSSGSAARVARLKGYENTVDCIGIQCYPFGNGNQSFHNELESTDDSLANYWRQAGAQGNRSLIANLQAFAWSDERIPTAEEMRVQAWLALLNGARGLVWYSYLPSGRDSILPDAHPHLWGELVRLIPEIRTVLPAITGGKFRRIKNSENAFFDDSHGTWHAGYWTIAGEMAVLVVNTHRKSAAAVDLPLPTQELSSCSPYFPSKRYNPQLKWAEGRLVGRLPPSSIGLYKISGAR